MRKFGWVLAVGCLLATARGDVQPWDYAFLLSAQAIAIPPSITIQWPQKEVPQIFLRRKLLTDGGWGSTVTLPGNATSYVDTNVEPGKAYEYEVQGVVQPDPQEIAYGYICTGSIIPPAENRGKVLLVVDQRFAGSLAGELEMLRKDLIGDGWAVVRRDVSPDSPPPEVKGMIRAEYNADPGNMQAVFLIGHVPAPYSGVLNPDMHPNHLGAWPADVYYGEMDGAWTDDSAFKTGSEFPWNDNVPGDGKFDQSTIPGRVELEVGRVDFWDMPSFGPRGEEDLLRNYLRKDHAFRHRTLNAAARGIIRDNFGTISDDAPAVDAWRAFPALFGQNNYTVNPPDQFFPVLQNDSYLFAYAGGGGDWEKADGVGTTANFVNGDPKGIFYLLHGSYFGDWNTTDNFLRAAIATPTYGLVSIWSSLPHWYFHPMALGETIGYATRLTQNNRNGVYRNSEDLSIGEVHISMMGDPTLHAFPLAPPSNLQLSISDKLSFSWNPSWQAVDGYYIYYAPSYDGPFQRATRRATTATTYDMPMLAGGHYVFMVKAIAVQTTGSGSFNNLSQGIFIEADINGAPPPPTPMVSIAATDSVGNEQGDSIEFTLTRSSGFDAALGALVEFSGTATLGQDFQAGTTVTFQPGSATATLTIVPTKDDVTEGEESVTVTLLGGTGYDLGSPNSATATIQADSPPPPPDPSVVTISATDPVGDENGDAIVFTLTRSAPMDAALNVAVEFSGTATQGMDYQALATVTFQRGNATATLTINPIADSINEMDESVIVTLVAGDGYVLGATSNATGTITGSGESKISAATLSPVGSFGFSATGFANRAYRVEARAPEGAWTTRTNGVAGADGAIMYRESGPAGGASVWYRVVWE
jgi:hypothetical protein